jgi:hypothetical protein
VSNILAERAGISRKSKLDALKQLGRLVLVGRVGKQSPRATLLKAAH